MAQVSLPVAGHLGVDGDHQRPVAGLFGPVDQLLGAGSAAPASTAGTTPVRWWLLPPAAMVWPDSELNVMSVPAAPAAPAAASSRPGPSST